MKEEGIDEEKLRNMMSQCEFVKGALCTPKESCTAERFTLFNRLNTLQLVDTQNKDKHLPLDDKQREKIETLAYKNAKVTFSQIRAELGLQDKLHIRFNLCSYKEKNPEYNKKIKCEVKNGLLQFDEKHKVVVNTETGEIILDKEIKDIFQKKFKPNYKQVTLYYSDIRKELQNSTDFKISDFRFQKFEKEYTKSVAELEREAKAKAEKKSKKAEDFDGEAAYIKQFEDDTFVELKGYHKIKKAIEKTDGKWEQI